ncbi:hypothetical protein BC830DRAFT_1110860 [Chytriomyces sp. MP71]|nr:hypothetical protein BC830DRAFT_1110860 [Chytriomyces sp. MP71]
MTSTPTSVVLVVVAAAACIVAALLFVAVSKRRSLRHSHHLHSPNALPFTATSNSSLRSQLKAIVGVAANGVPVWKGGRWRKLRQDDHSFDAMATDATSTTSSNGSLNTVEALKNKKYKLTLDASKRRVIDSTPSLSILSDRALNRAPQNPFSHTAGLSRVFSIPPPSPLNAVPTKPSSSSTPSSMDMGNPFDGRDTTFATDGLHSVHSIEGEDVLQSDTISFKYNLLGGNNAESVSLHTN